MAVYHRILFQKSRGTNRFKEGKPHCGHSSESTPSDGSTIKEFYESVIAIAKQPDTSESTVDSSSTAVRPLKRRKRVTRVIPPNAFLKAAADGDLKVAKSFVEQNSDINIRDDFGWTALMCACCSGQVEVVLYLLNHGAKWIDVKDKSGADALSLAQQAGHIQIVNLLRNNGSHMTGCDNDVGEAIEPFYCSSCKTNIETLTSKEHKSSTVHQFCTQHTKQSTMYYLNDSNKGYQMMLKDGWDSEQGLGPDGRGMKFPVKTTLKRDRQCLGSKSKDCRPRITHFKPFDTTAVKRQKTNTTTKEVPVSKKHGIKKKSRKWEMEYRQSWNSETN